MDIRKIEYFMKVAETLNFSKAAEQLHISHQALSKQIQQLEREVGAKLLERTTTRVSLTEVGAKLYEIFLPIIRDMHHGYDELLEFVKYKKDTLRIGSFSTLSYSRVISPVVQFLNQEAPRIRIDILATDIGLEQQLLQQDSIDLAISLLFDEKEWKDMSYIELMCENLRIIVSDKHPWYRHESVGLEEIANENMLVYENRPSKGADAFLYGLQVKDRIPVRNADSYMVTLQQGNCFGIIGENYSRREGNFKLFELPAGYERKVPVIAAFKKHHPCAEVIRKISKKESGKL